MSLFVSEFRNRVVDGQQQLDEVPDELAILVTPDNVGFVRPDSVKVVNTDPEKRLTITLPKRFL